MIEILKRFFPQRNPINTPSFQELDLRLEQVGNQSSFGHPEISLPLLLGAYPQEVAGKTRYVFYGGFARFPLVGGRTPADIDLMTLTPESQQLLERHTDAKPYGEFGRSFFKGLTLPKKTEQFVKKYTHMLQTPWSIEPIRAVIPEFQAVMKLLPAKGIYELPREQERQDIISLVSVLDLDKLREVVNSLLLAFPSKLRQEIIKELSELSKKPDADTTLQGLSSQLIR